MADHDDFAAVVELGHPIECAPGADPHVFVIFAAGRTPQPEPAAIPGRIVARSLPRLSHHEPHVLLADIRFDGQFDPQVLRDYGAAQSIRPPSAPGCGPAPSTAPDGWGIAYHDYPRFRRDGPG